MLQKIRITNGAKDYIKQELSSGGELSRRLLEIDFDKGYVFTFLPEDFTLQKQFDYAESLEYVFGEKVSEEFTSLIKDYIVNYLDANSRRMAIFETLWNVNDPSVSKRPVKYFSLYGAKYDFIKGDGDDLKQLDTYIIDAQGYPTVIILVDAPQDNLSVKPKSEIDAKTISIIVNQTRAIIIGAFDGEGYIIWQQDL